MPHRFSPERQAALVQMNKFMGAMALGLVLAFLLVWWLWPDLLASGMGRRP